MLAKVHGEHARIPTADLRRQSVAAVGLVARPSLRPLVLHPSSLAQLDRLPTR